jgi:hypothetical protein
MSDTAYNDGPAMMAARGQTYGKAGQQMEAQRAVPMRKPPTETRPAPLTPLLAPTQRPEEPITAGAPFGPGVGPEALGVPVAPQVGDVDDLALRVRAIASQFPNAALLGLLAELES